MNTHTIPNDYFFHLVEEELKEGKDVEFIVKGYSMTPLLRNMKDSVVLYPCRKEEPKLLDCVLFRYNGRHILHRIVKIEDDHYTMQGDGIYASQEHCSRKDIVGVVRYIIRGGKKTETCNRYYQLYVKVWHRLRFMRRYLLFVYRAIARLTRR